MNSYFEGRDGGGCFSDLFRPKDQRHLRDEVGACLAAEAPHADWKRAVEANQRAAKQAYAQINNGAASTFGTYNQTIVRVEGGEPVRYYGEDAARVSAQQRLPHTPRPPLPRYVEDEGLLIDGERPAKPSGKRRIPTAPATARPGTALDPSGGGIHAPPSRGEVQLFGTGRGPRTVYKSYRDTDPGWGGEPTRDIVYNDAHAAVVPSKSEWVRFAKATIPNKGEEEAAARARGGSASARLPTVWRRPNYPHPWMREESRKDALVYNGIRRQKKERVQRHQQAEANLNTDYAKLSGAALSVSSPRYLAEERQRAASAKAAGRRERLEAAWAAKEAVYMQEREARKALEAASPSPREGGGKHLSSNMRKEIAAVFKRMQV